MTHEDDPGYHDWLAQCAHDCRCCPMCSPEGRPCSGCTAGGVCDAFRCTCDVELDDLEEDADAG